MEISWNDVQEFVQRLNEAAGEEVYRLPTEAEWEYACRAGTSARWSFGDDEGRLGEYAWYYSGNVSGAGFRDAQPVGTKLANPWGLFDMHGNVYEWVQDRYGPYSSAAQLDPQGPSTGSLRMFRGGGVRLWRLVHAVGVSLLPLAGPPTTRILALPVGTRPSRCTTCSVIVVLVAPVSRIARKVPRVRFLGRETGSCAGTTLHSLMGTRERLRKKVVKPCPGWGISRRQHAS